MEITAQEFYKAMKEQYERGWYDAKKEEKQIHPLGVWWTPNEITNDQSKAWAKLPIVDAPQIREIERYYGTPKSEQKEPKKRGRPRKK